MTQQSKDELEQHLREQAGFLRSSCAAFDAGEHAEAKRLAHQIRILVHDTSNSQSLLGQLGVKQSLRWVTTATPIRPDNLLSTPGLVQFRMGPDGMRYEAPLGDLSPARQRVPQEFTEWWTEHVIKADDGELFSRNALVLAVAHKDGGSHVDPTIEEAYARLTRNNSLGWVEVVDGIENALGNPVLPSIRQIAYEVLDTIGPIVEALRS